MAVMKILMMIAGLVVILMMRRPCAEGIATMFNNLAPPMDAGVKRPDAKLP